MDCVKSFKGGRKKKKKLCKEKRLTREWQRQRCLHQRQRLGRMRGHSAAGHPQNEGVIKCRGKKKKAEREKKVSENMEGLEWNLLKNKMSLENTRDWKKNGRSGHWGAWCGHLALPAVRGTTRNNPPSRGLRMGRKHLSCPIPASHSHGLWEAFHIACSIQFPNFLHKDGHTWEQCHGECFGIAGPSLAAYGIWDRRPIGHLNTPGFGILVCKMGRKTASLRKLWRVRKKM